MIQKYYCNIQTRIFSVDLHQAVQLGTSRLLVSSETVQNEHHATKSGGKVQHSKITSIFRLPFIDLIEHIYHDITNTGKRNDLSPS